MAVRALAVLLVLHMLTACDQGTVDPVLAVERYLLAKVAGDRDTIQRLLCSNMEADIEREAQSFNGVSQARLEGMDCRQEGDGPIVRCVGKIVATYGAEQSELSLAAYRVAWEDGEWKWCGEAR